MALCLREVSFRCITHNTFLFPYDQFKHHKVPLSGLKREVHPNLRHCEPDEAGEEGGGNLRRDDGPARQPQGVQITSWPGVRMSAELGITTRCNNTADKQLRETEH